MDATAYQEMAEAENVHWWFSARRTILTDVIARLDLHPCAAILEVGCGTGGNLEMLSRFGKLSAVEMNPDAAALAQDKIGSAATVHVGACPQKLPFDQGSFDLICMFDVLEHIEEDRAALFAMRSLLKEDGRILLTVPAYRWLWGRHDVHLHHKRRYSRSALVGVAADAGLRPVRTAYFNTFLFFLAVLGRLKDRLLPDSPIAGTKIPTPLFNNALSIIFSSERFLLRRSGFPFGVSLLGVFQRA